MNAAVSGFTDRRHADRMLAAALGRYANREDVIVPDLPRGDFEQSTGADVKSLLAAAASHTSEPMN